MKPEIFKSPFGKISYSLVTSRKKYKKFCKENGLEINSQVASIECDACVVTHHNDGVHHCIVVLLIQGEEDKNHLLSVLAHESVHVYQEFRDYIGEESPGPEFEAYTIQEIFLNLITELDKQKNNSSQ